MDTLQGDVGTPYARARESELLYFVSSLLSTINGIRSADGVSFVDVNVVPECASLSNQALLVHEFFVPLYSICILQLGALMASA